MLITCRSELGRLHGDVQLTHVSAVGASLAIKHGEEEPTCISLRGLMLPLLELLASPAIDEPFST